jgi:hypothetical protein
MAAPIAPGWVKNATDFLRVSYFERDLSSGGSRRGSPTRATARPKPINASIQPKLLKLRNQWRFGIQFDSVLIGLTAQHPETFL